MSNYIDKSALGDITLEISGALWIPGYLFSFAIRPNVSERWRVVFDGTKARTSVPVDVPQGGSVRVSGIFTDKAKLLENIQAGAVSDVSTATSDTYPKLVPRVNVALNFVPVGDEATDENLLKFWQCRMEGMQISRQTFGQGVAYTAASIAFSYISVTKGSEEDPDKKDRIKY